MGIVYKLVLTDGAKLLLFKKVTCPVGELKWPSLFEQKRKT